MSPGALAGMAGASGASSGSSQPSILVERQRRYFVGAKADQAKIEVERLEVAKLDLEKIIIPAGIQRQLVVGQHVGALLGL